MGHKLTEDADLISAVSAVTCVKESLNRNAWFGARGPGCKGSVF